MSKCRTWATSTVQHSQYTGVCSVIKSSPSNLKNNTHFPINAVTFKAVSLWLYTGSPASAPLFEAFCKVCCLKFGKQPLQFCLNHGGINQSTYPLMLSRIFGERKKSQGVLNLVSRKGVYRHSISSCLQIHAQTKHSEQAHCKGGKNLSDTFRLSGQLLCSDWNEIPNMSATPQTVILLLLRKCSFMWLTFSFVLFVDGYPEHSTTSIEDKPLVKIRKPLKTLCSSHSLFHKNYFQHYESFNCISSCLKQNVM